MPGYFIAQINIRDEEEYQKYLDGFDEVFSKHNGKVVAVDDDVNVLEGEWPFGRTVIIRFPSKADLSSWYESEEYQRIA
ncbi:MAG: DUF1330 domain-containing protein, partial [Desulfobacterales bacterium]|nr:DUF1330 domain-containing protein [Desulfobacterales bacterium]